MQPYGTYQQLLCIPVWQKHILLFITCPYSSHHEKQLLLTSFSDNFIQIWYLISYPMYWCVIILHLCVNLCSYTCVHYYRTVLPVQSPHLMISWLSTGTTVLQIHVYHKFLYHVSLALTMEVLLSTCFVTPRFKFFTMTVSVDYYVKKKKRHTERDNFFLFYIVQSVYFYESYFFVWTLLIVYKYISNPLLFSFYSINNMNLKHQLNNADQIRKIMKIYL